MQLLAIIFIVFLKFAIPVLLVFFPFAGGWANFVLDTIDGDMLIPLGLNSDLYQIIDKIADWGTYVAMVVAAWRLKWPIRRWIYILFGLRSIGQLLFLIFHDERLFFFFPNFLEPLFLVYATIAFYGKKKAPKIYEKHKVLIWSGVIIYKLQDELLTHIVNVDRSELIQRLFQ